MLCKVFILFISFFSFQKVYSNYSIKMAIGSVFLKDFGEKTDTKIDFTKLPLEIKYGKMLIIDRGYLKLSNLRKQNSSIIASQNTILQIEEKLSLKNGNLKIYNDTIKVGTFEISSRGQYYLLLNRDKHYMDIINSSYKKLRLKSLIGKFRKNLRYIQAIRLNLTNSRVKKIKYIIPKEKFIQPIGILIDDIIDTPLSLDSKNLKGFKTQFTALKLFDF